MHWTEEHDTLLCREIRAVDPFDTKKGTAQRGEKWKVIADNVMTIERPKFKVEARSVRDRYRFLAQKVQRKLNDEEKASGIETDMVEWETIVEELIEKERECDSAHDADAEVKCKKKEYDRLTADGMRRKAMERIGKSKKSGEDDENAEQETRPKKRRSNGSDTLMYLREKNESMEKFRKEEMEMKRREVELQEKKHDDFMKMMLAQQQLQAQKMQEFQTMMLALMSRMVQK